MKKFLSLLLALTLVLSLVVVPARAHDADGYSASGNFTLSADKTNVDSGTTVTLTANNGITVTKSGVETQPEYDVTYEWSGGGISESDKTKTSLEVTPVNTDAADKVITYSCKLTIKDGQTEILTRNQSVNVTVVSVQGKANAAFKADITAVTYNDRNYLSGGKVTAYRFDGDTANDWDATLKTGSIYSLASENAVTFADGTVTVNGTYTDNSQAKNVTATFANSSLSDANVEVAVDPTDATILSGGSVKLTATANGFTDPKYSWYDTSDTSTILGTSKTFTWTLTNAGESNITKSIKCKVTNGSAQNAPYKESAAKDITVQPAGSFSLITVVTEPLNATNSIVLSPTTKTAKFASTFVNKSSSQDSLVTEGVKYAYEITGSTSAFTISGENTSELTVTLKNGGSGSITVKPYVVYKGKTFEASPYKTYTISTNNLTAQLSSVQSGSYRDYSYSEFASAALSAIKTKFSSSSSEKITNIANISQDTSSSSCGRISYNNISYTGSGVGSGYMRYQANAVVNTAKINATVTTNYRTCYITFNLPIAPARVTYADQYPEPVASGNTYRYYVEVPSGYKYYYVVGTPNQSTEPNWNLSGQRYDGTTNGRCYLTDANFVGGKCTLWLITVDSRGAYSCGQLTVYQKNYNINYNGVAGENVQFAQSDFNDFMNEIAEARGDASKTKSYPYVTFDSVTFSLPTTAQGTLYYGGTAMSTSSSSGAFNNRTKVTNLDSVTFVPNAKTTAKAITLNFTLYATRYSSSSTSRGTTVSYSGSVVVNLVREDIKYTVSQGDSVRFDESDFLSYLRSTKGYTSNYTIDYVTFDQSAVSAVNEGSLYTYYNGYNYGGSVKTTDKFYYSATASQNALSDVAFLASRYAKTGETVYIPFTIYARYGTTGTGTRQLTGTVAIKIGQTMNFIDVKTTDYFYNSVKWAVGKNITNGTSSTTFSPYKSCTRAEIVTFLWRAAGSPEPTTTRNPFRDVNAVTHSSYYKAILWASQKGITSGTSTTAFSPDQVCTRAQIVTFLYRYAGQPSGYYSNPFKDVGATSEASYYKAILWAVGKGITTGTSATTFSPYASCNRAEAVTFLYRYTNGL